MSYVREFYEFSAQVLRSRDRKKSPVRPMNLSRLVTHAEAAKQIINNNCKSGGGEAALDYFLILLPNVQFCIICVT